MYGSLLNVLENFYEHCDNFFLIHSTVFSPPWYFLWAYKLLHICVRMTLKSHNICLRNAINLENHWQNWTEYLIFPMKTKKKLKKIGEKKKKSETSIKMKCCTQICTGYISTTEHKNCSATLFQIDKKNRTRTLRS